MELQQYFFIPRVFRTGEQDEKYRSSERSDYIPIQSVRRSERLLKQSHGEVLRESISFIFKAEINHECLK